YSVGVVRRRESESRGGDCETAQIGVIGRRTRFDKSCCGHRSLIDGSRESQREDPARADIYVIVASTLEPGGAELCPPLRLTNGEVRRSQPCFHSVRG